MRALHAALSSIATLVSTVLISTVLISAVLASGCAAPGPERSLYERLGGRERIQTIVADAFANVSRDGRINARFANAEPEQFGGNLVDLICERTGGPCVYKGRNMADAHEDMHIRDAEFDAMVEDLVASMDKFGVGPREQREALAIIAKMRNAIVGH